MSRARSRGDRGDAEAPVLRLELPCKDEGDFYARLGDHVAQRGLRIPTEEQRPVGTRVTIALGLKNGEALTGEGVIDGHVRMETRSGVNVRILRFEPRAGAARRDGGPAARAAAGREPLGDLLFGDGAAESPPVNFGSSTVSREIVAVVNRRAARVQRAVIALAAAALVIGAAGLAAVRWWQPVGPESAAAAHVKAADRLFAEGRLTGKDGAIEHLLAAKRLHPEDEATTARLSRAADVLEALAARALERGDAAVAEIHLGWARRAAPDRASIRAQLDALAKRGSAKASPPTTGAASRRRPARR